MTNRNSYCTHEHIGCGGELTFSKRINDKGIIKNLYRCDKCNALINCIIFPSWKDYHGE